jgi:hypothetical protein
MIFGGSQLKQKRRWTFIGEVSESPQDILLRKEKITLRRRKNHFCQQSFDLF